MTLGQAIAQKAVSVLLTVVAYLTYRRYVGQVDPSLSGRRPRASTRKLGRPRTPDEIRELVIRLARETVGWGYTRILGELRKLGIKICHSTMINILRQEQIDPKTDPNRGGWAEFLKAHAGSLWQCDFFSKHVVMAEGVLRQCFAEGCRAIAAPFRAPNVNAYVERFVQAVQQECLDKFIAFGPEHLDHLVREYVAYYHTERPHQGRGNRPLTIEGREPPGEGEVLCREGLGGVLRHYYRRMAA